MLGIFWVIDGALFFYKQSMEATVGEEKTRVEATGIIDGSLSHFEAWDKELAKKHPDADFATYPRGRVVFDVVADRHIIYVDECITNGEIVDIVKSFEIKEYQIAYDEHYTCDNCIGEKGLF